jgi:branched-chain amino acid transport system substrate-binding protein
MDPAAAERSWHGVQLAVEEANRAENQVGGRRVQVLHPNCSNEKEALRAAAVRLLAINKAAALLGGTDAGQVDVLGLVAEAAKVPLVAAGGLPNRSGGFVLHTGVSPSYQGKVLARFAGAQWKGKAVAVLTNLQESSGAASRTLAAVFAGDLKTNGGRTVGEWTYKNSTELKELAGSIGAEKADAVLIAGTVEDVLELRKAGLADATPVALGSSEGALTALQARPIPNPVYLATAFIAGQGPAPAQEFARKYQDRFHEAPDVHAALAYDSARLLFEGIRRAGSAEGDKVRNALAEVKNFDSVTGPMTLDPDHWAARPLFLIEVRRGQLRTIQTFDPET